MRKILLALMFVFVCFNAGFAQTKKAKTVAPNVIVKNLYAAQKADKGLFFQTKNRV